MELTILERIQITNTFPQEDDFVNLIIKKNITEKLNLSIEEIEKYNIRQHEKGLTFTVEASSAKNNYEFNLFKEKFGILISLKYFLRKNNLIDFINYHLWCNTFSTLKLSFCILMIWTPVPITSI
jgi:hypothetical protein